MGLVISAVVIGALGTAVMDVGNLLFARFGFLVYPSMGFGLLGLRSPEGWKAVLSRLTNHLFYGLGLAAGLVAWH